MGSQHKVNKRRVSANISRRFLRQGNEGRRSAPRTQSLRLPSEVQPDDTQSRLGGTSRASRVFTGTERGRGTQRKAVQGQEGDAGDTQEIGGAAGQKTEGEAARARDMRQESGLDSRRLHFQQAETSP